MVTPYFKQALRDPAFLILTVVSILILYLGYSTGGWASIGGMGRNLLSVSYHFYSALIGLLVLSVVFPQLRHSDELWSTSFPLPSRILQQGFGLLCASLLSILIAVVIVAPFKLSLTAFSFSGLAYFAFYFLLTVIYLALWISVGMVTAYLSRSRVLTIAVPALLWAILWLGVPMILILGLNQADGPRGIPVMVRFLNPASLYWFSPLAPFGVTPIAVLWQTLAMVGLILLSLAAILYLFRRRGIFGKSIRIRTIAMLLVAGVFGFIGGGMGVAWVASGSVADYSVVRLLKGEVELGSPPRPIDSRGNVLSLLGEYSAFNYPENKPLPDWVEQRAKNGQYHTLRLDEIVLSYPAGRYYPAELNGMAKQIEIIIGKAYGWLGVEQKLLIIPRQFSFAQDPKKIGLSGGVIYYDPNYGMVLSEDIVEEGLNERASWDIARVLAEIAGFHEVTSVYLAMALMEEFKPDSVEKVLQIIEKMMNTEESATRDSQYIYIEPNKSSDDLWATREKIRSLGIDLTSPLGAESQGVSTFAEMIKQLEEQKWPGIHEARNQLYPICCYQIDDPYAAWLLLQYWQKGSATGHENFIRGFLGAAQSGGKDEK